jgi:cytochrome c oxidase assembly protein subunit 11
MNQSDKNKRTLLVLAACAVAMLGAAYASVPLYKLFCSATGYNGTTQRVAFDAKDSPAPEAARAVTKPQVKDRLVTVTFDGNVDSNLPWDFAPDVKSVTVKLGEIANISYHAHNRSSKTVVGTATFNVQPDKVGGYFDKIQCFCFTKQVLKAGESVELPVQFYIDPALAKDHQSDDVQNITLSYTFFLAKDQSKARSNAASTTTPAPESLP